MAIENESNSLLIFTDSEPGKEFVSTLERELNVSSQIFVLDSFWIVKVNKTIKHLAYFIYAWKAFRKRKEGLFMYFPQQAIAFYYSVFMRFVSASDRPAATTPVIYKERGGMLGKMRKLLFRFYLTSPSINSFVVHSQAEKIQCQNLLMPSQQDKIHFIHLGFGTPVLKDDKPADISHSDSYFFCGGTSNRDYRTLIKAFEGLSETLKIICRKQDLKGFYLPSNVKARYGVYMEDFIEEMRNSLAVIIPLGSQVISSGHLLLLQAMRWGKPIILTDQSGVADYIDKNSVLLVRTAVPQDIKEAVLRLKNDKELRNKLANSSAKRYNEFFTGAKYAARLAFLLKQAHPHFRSQSE